MTTVERTRAASRKRSAVSRAAGNIVNAMMRRLDVASVEIDDLTARRIDVGRIELGDASIEQIDIADVSASIDTGNAQLINVRNVVRINLSLDWRVRLPFVRDPRGTIGPLEIPIPFKLGDVTVPDIDTIDVEIPSASVSGTQIDIQPITNLRFDGGAAEAIGLNTLNLPSDGFGISGLGYDTFSLDHIGLPDGAIADARIERLSPNGPLTLPNTEIRRIELPDVDVPTVNSTSPVNVEDVSASIIPDIPGIDLGILVLKLNVRPTMDMNIERLSLTGMQASSSINRISLRNIRSPVEVHDVTINGIRLNGLTVNQVSL